MKRVSLSCVLSIFAIVSGQAAILRPLNPLQVIEVPISKQDLTRITLEGDRITSVFGLSEEYSLEVDDAQGQVFIRPRVAAPISLVLTTESGQTQDLRLVPKAIPSEPIILKQSMQKAPQKGISRREVEELLEACRTNRIPLGYKEMSLGLARPKALIRELRSEKLRGLTFELPPGSHRSAQEFAKVCGIPNIIAIIIREGEAYVVARRP